MTVSGYSTTVSFVATAEAAPHENWETMRFMGGTATEAAAVGDGVCVAEVSAELLAGCGAVVTIVLLILHSLHPQHPVSLPTDYPTHMSNREYEAVAPYKPHTEDNAIL